MNLTQNTCTGSVGKSKFDSNNSTVYLVAARAHGNKTFFFFMQLIVLFPPFC